MLTVYMAIWSIFLIVLFGVTRIRNGAQLLFVSGFTALVLFVSQALFEQLSLVAGLHPSVAMMDPGLYLGQGPVAWIALLVMPFGWLGPVLGLQIVQRWQRDAYQIQDERARYELG